MVEIEEVIASLKIGKSPGQMAFQTKSIKMLSPRLHKTFLRAKELGSLPPSAYEPRPLMLNGPIFGPHLRTLVFGQDFIGWVKLLYYAPMARISVNGWLSEAFHLNGGTRQECPLFPLLYA